MGQDSTKHCCHRNQVLQTCTPSQSLSLMMQQEGFSSKIDAGDLYLASHTARHSPDHERSMEASAHLQ
jgi:hypothetical protein